MPVLGGIDRPILFGADDSTPPLHAQPTVRNSAPRIPQAVVPAFAQGVRLNAVRKVVSSSGRGCENVVVMDGGSAAEKSARGAAWVGSGDETRCVLELVRNHRTLQRSPAQTTALRISITPHSARACPRHATVLTSNSTSGFRKVHKFGLSGKEEHSCFLPLEAVERYVMLLFEGGSGHHHRIARLELVVDTTNQPNVETSHHTNHTNQTIQTNTSQMDPAPRASPLPFEVFEEECGGAPPPKTAQSPQCDWAVRQNEVAMGVPPPMLDMGQHTLPPPPPYAYPGNTQDIPTDFKPQHNQLSDPQNAHYAGGDLNPPHNKGMPSGHYTQGFPTSDLKHNDSTVVVDITGASEIFPDDLHSNRLEHRNYEAPPHSFASDAEHLSHDTSLHASHLHSFNQTQSPKEREKRDDSWRDISDAYELEVTRERVEASIESQMQGRQGQQQHDASRCSSQQDVTQSSVEYNATLEEVVPAQCNPTATQRWQPLRDSAPSVQLLPLSSQGAVSSNGVQGTLLDTLHTAPAAAPVFERTSTTSSAGRKKRSANVSYTSSSSSSSSFAVSAPLSVPNSVPNTRPQLFTSEVRVTQMRATSPRRRSDETVVIEVPEEREKEKGTPQQQPLNLSRSLLEQSVSGVTPFSMRSVCAEVTPPQEVQQQHQQQQHISRATPQPPSYPTQRPLQGADRTPPHSAGAASSRSSGGSSARSSQRPSRPPPSIPLHTERKCATLPPQTPHEAFERFARPSGNRRKTQTPSDVESGDGGNDTALDTDVTDRMHSLLKRIPNMGPADRLFNTAMRTLISSNIGDTENPPKPDKMQKPKSAAGGDNKSVARSPLRPILLSYNTE